MEADRSDGFHIYENGGATAAFAFYTIAALYKLGRLKDGDRILFPMLESYKSGASMGGVRMAGPSIGRSGMALLEDMGDCLPMVLWRWRQRWSGRQRTTRKTRIQESDEPQNLQ